MTDVASDRHVYHPLRFRTSMTKLIAVMAAVTDKPAWLVGSSMGGGLALDVALMAPELVAGLVLIAPAVSGDTEFEIDPDTAHLDQLLDEAIEPRKPRRGKPLGDLVVAGSSGQPEGRVRDRIRSLATRMNEIILGNDVPEDAGASGFDALGRINDFAPQSPLRVASSTCPF